MSGAVPRLRFPGFEGDWKRSTAGMLFLNRRERGEAGLPIYSVTIDRGLVPRNELDRHLGADAADEANLRAQSDDIVYNTMRMWQGAVGIATEECMVSPAYVVLQPRPETDAAMFFHWFKSRRMLGRLTAYSHGLTTDRLRLYFEDFAQIPLFVPEMKEQRRIATFLGAIDAKIDALRRKQAALIRFKAGLTQKLFSQELRFRREDGSEFQEWTPATLGELYDFLPTNSLARTDLTDEASEFRNVHYGDIHTKLPSLISGVDHVFPWVRVDKAAIAARQRPLRPGDVILADASEDLNDIGKAVEVVAVDERPIVAGLHTIHASPKVGRELAIGFASHLFRSANVRRRLEKEAHGTKVLGLSPARVAQVEVLLPCHDEQHAITGALSTTDAKIRATHAKIAHLETFKKGLLQQMFV